MAAEAVEDFVHRGKKSLQRALAKGATELTLPREKTKTERSERRLRCAEWESHAGIGGRLPRMAAEAGADIAHGWHVFFVVGVYSMVRRL